MRLLILAFSLVGLFGLTACDAGQEEEFGVGTETEQGIGDVGTQDEGIMQEEMGQQEGMDQEGERAPAGTEGLTQESCEALQEDGITEDEQEMFQRCQDAGFL